MVAISRPRWYWGMAHQDTAAKRTHPRTAAQNQRDATTRTGRRDIAASPCILTRLNPEHTARAISHVVCSLPNHTMTSDLARPLRPIHGIHMSTPSTSELVRAVLRGNPALPADEVIKRLKARGSTASPDTI